MSNKNSLIRKNIQFRDNLFVLRGDWERIWDGHSPIFYFALVQGKIGPKTQWINRMYKDMIEK